MKIHIFSGLFSAMPKKILNAKVACLDFSLQKTKMKLGVQVLYSVMFCSSLSSCNCSNFLITLLNLYVVLLKVLVTDPEKLEAIRDREADITKERVQKILAAGANVILCSGGIDDLCLKVCKLLCIISVAILII